MRSSLYLFDDEPFERGKAKGEANLGAKAPVFIRAMRPEAEASGYLFVVSDLVLW
jgi:hypothetical protein